MKISTKGRYGLRALVEIAAQKGNVTTLKSVANKLGLSLGYLEQLFKTMKKAGFISSTRGACGGYVLSCDPEKTSVLDIVTVLEGQVYPVDCVSNGEKSSCGDGDCRTCVAKNVWEKMYDSMSDVLNSVSLKNLVEDFDKMNIESINIESINIESINIEPTNIETTERKV